MIDEINTYNSFPSGDQSQGSKKDIKDVASEFESLFIYYMLKTMRESMIKGGLFGSEKGEEFYRSMLDEELSMAIARAGGIGLKDVILNRLEIERQSSHEDKEDKEEGIPVGLLNTPANKGVLEYLKKEHALNPVSGYDGFKLPVNGAISSGYGIRKDPLTGENRFHYGIDIQAPEGTPVHPAMEGTIVFSGESPGYGNVIEIRHDNGYVTRYAHNRENLAKEGDRVATSDVVALVGRTGRATGPHLHFEIRAEGFAVNPVKIIFRG